MCMKNNYFKILDFFDEFDVLLAKTSLVGSDVNDGPVQFLNFNVQFSDVDFQFLDMFALHNLFLSYAFNLRQKFIYFLLEFGLFLFSSATRINSI